MMNSKPMVAMKKFWMMLLAAATLAGCQKSEDVAPEADQITIKATMSFDAASRTTILEQDGNYLARWTEEDKDNIKLLTIRSDGAVGAIDAKDIHLENDGETATFEFEMYPEMMDDSYTFVAVNGFAFSGINSEAFWLQLKDAQTQDEQNYYDTAADLIVSKPIPVDKPTGDLNLNFTMARMNALLKLSLKNFTLAEEEKIQSVTFACEQPLAGSITVNFADLDGVTYPIPYTLDGEESKSITFDLQAGGDLYLSTLPATLKAGESYTVTVKTNQKYIIKEGTLAADLVLTAGDITSVSVNMGDAATKSRVENLSEEYEYAIGYTTAEGVTYLLDRTGTTKNPVGAEISSLGLSLSSTGSLIGEVSKLYRWKFAPASDGKVSFYYQTNSGNVFHLTAGNKNQGIAIQKLNDEGKYVSGAYYSDGVEYFDAFTVEPKEGGHYMNVAGARYLDYVVAQNRFIGNTKEGATGVVNFYRIQPAPQKTLYPVITKAADITEGTYVILHHKEGVYYALPNLPVAASPAGVPIADVKMTIEDGCVTAADVDEKHKWVITKRTKDDGSLYYQMRPWTDSSYWLWHKNNSTGMAIEKVDILGGSYIAQWNFEDHTTAGLNMNGANADHKRYAIINQTTFNWGTLGGPNGSIVLVKLSDSIDFKSAE